MLLWHLQGPKSLAVSSSVFTRYIPPPSEKLSCPASSSISGNSCTPNPQPNGFHLPASWQNHSNKSITSSHGRQGSPQPLVTIDPAAHIPCWFILFPSTAPTWPCLVCNVLLPWAGSIWDQPSAFTLIVLVWGVVCSVIYYYWCWRVLHSSNGWIGGGQNSTLELQCLPHEAFPDCITNIIICLSLSYSSLITRLF